MKGSIGDDLDEDVEVFDEDDEQGWDEVDVGDGTTIRLPDPEQYGFRDHVEVLANASSSWSAYGPMTHENREYICRVDDVYMVRTESDGGSSNTIIGRFNSEGSGVAACIDASDAFVPDVGGAAVSAWSDEDEDGDIDDSEVWDPDDDPDDVAPPPVALTRHVGPQPPRRGCLVRPSGGRLVRSARWAPEVRFSQEQRLKNQERLWRTSIVHHGVVIAGEDASGELPSNGTRHVIPCDTEQFGHLERVVGSAEWATVSVDGDTLDAVLTEGLAATTAARVGSAFGADEVWQLDRDAIRTVFTDPPMVVAQGVRVR